MRIALIEDSLFILDAWKVLADYDIEAFTCPEDFCERYAADQNGLLTLAAVVTDFHFDEASALNGRDVLHWVKQRQGPPVLLSTDGIRQIYAHDGFAALIDKDPLSRYELGRILATLAR